jgi:hypothetical protein
MAYTLMSKIFKGGTGGGIESYFQQGDIELIKKRIVEAGETLVALQMVKIVIPKGGHEEKIYGLAGAYEVDNPAGTSKLFEGERAVVALPCPPFNFPEGQYIDENGNKADEPEPDK